MVSVRVIGCLFCFKQKTAYEMRISDWSSDVCSSDLHAHLTMKGNHAAETGSMMLICCCLFDEPIALVALCNEGQRRKRRKRRAEYHWPAAWSAAAVEKAGVQQPVDLAEMTVAGIQGALEIGRAHV